MRFYQVIEVREVGIVRNIACGDIDRDSVFPRDIFLYCIYFAFDRLRGNVRHWHVGVNV